MMCQSGKLQVMLETVPLPAGTVVAAGQKMFFLLS